MKKILIPILALLLSFGTTTSFAQAKTKAKTEQKATPTTAKTKKDGTPDMRYKENKEGAKPAPKHMKKDGTPDKRYKENQK